jgi:Spy/CpxP family protein refolding chaperone
MTKKVTLLIAAVLMIVSGSLALEAAARRPDMIKHARFGIRMAEKNMYPAKMLLRFKDEIGLTGQQVGKIEKMRTLFQEAAIRRKADIKIQQMKLQNYIQKDKIDRKKMEHLIRGVAKMKTDMQIDHMNYLLDVKSVLTADQLKKIDEFKKKRRRQRYKNRRPNRNKQRSNRNPRGTGGTGGTGGPNQPDEIEEI